MTTYKNKPYIVRWSTPTGDNFFYKFWKENQKVKNKRFTTKCCHCGMCCLVENCPIAIEKFGIPKYDFKCPALNILNGQYICSIALSGKQEEMEALGIGHGCCISAKVYIHGNANPVDFASMTDDAKHAAVSHAIANYVPIQNKKKRVIEVRNKAPYSS